MSFLKDSQIIELQGKITDDLSLLGKIYKAKKSDYMTISVDHGLAENYEKEGWEVASRLKTKTRLKKLKISSKIFEDSIWCQLYELGFRKLNFDETFSLPFGKNPEEKKQIDVIAIDKETIILIECKSALKPQQAPSYKDEFDLLKLRLDGFRKALIQVFGDGYKIKYVFATKNLRIETDSVDLKRLNESNSYYYNDNTYKYISDLIKKYKGAAHYQFLGLLFKNQLISDKKIEIPAIEGFMGKKKYYMFSIEPDLLLKMGFVLHRTRANEEELPTYQRLLQPNRLKGITKFVNDGGYFPNSLIVNFSSSKNKLIFESSSKPKDSNSRFGTLKIPNAYAIAYIIDGQHRLYGYANSEYKKSNTVPVVAFNDLSPREQLEIFMDINQNQKAVSPSLRLTLEEDLFWDSDRAASRLKALRSSIIRDLSENTNNVLSGKISIGEDTSLLSFKPFYNAIKDSGLLPTAKGNTYVEESLEGSLYNTNNHDHEKEMFASKKKIIQLVNLSYGFVEKNYPSIYEKDKYFILSNRGTYAFITLLGSLNTFLTKRQELNIKSSSLERFEAIEKYLVVLMDHIQNIPKEEEQRQLSLLGAGADIKWLRFFQNIINTKFLNYNPIELVDWRERQDEEIQAVGQKYGVAIEKKMKKIILEKLEQIFEDNWDLEIASIKRKCEEMSSYETEKQYKETGNRPQIPWTDMFTINDYNSIIKKFWTKTPENEVDGFKTFMEEFSIDIGEKFNSQTERTKWISYFNSYRNCWAHAGTKSKGLNKKEVDHLKLFYNHFYEN